jgi:sulfatase maturation enzyme AslB (radical SAM superfamily)
MEIIEPNKPIFCMEPYVHVDILVENSKISKKVCNIFYGNNTSKEIIDMHAQGIWPPGCQSCQFLEKNNLKSRRVGINEVYKNQGITGLDHIQAVSLRYGTLCNLRCMICDDSRSSAWANENLKFNKKVHDRYIYDKNSLPPIDKVLNGIDISKVKSWDFHGGEPLLSNYPWEVLQIADTKSQFKFNTNGTVFPDRIRKFAGKKVEMILSIDDIEERFEYQRYPAKWTTVVNNINNFKKLGFKVSVTPTISNINVWDFPSSIEWLVKAFGLKIYLQFVDYPKKLAVNNLNPNTKKELLNHYKKFNNMEKILRPIINKINDPGEEIDFLSYVNEIDRRRNQNFSKTFNEWSKILEDTMYR